MSRKAKISLILIPISIVLLLLVLYISLSLYYKEGFSYGTWINGVYCTGKGINEINEELKTKYENSAIIIIYEEKEYYIYPEDIDYTIDFTAYLKDILDKQNSFLWIKNLFIENETTDIIPDFSYNTEKLDNVIRECKVVKSNTYSQKHSVNIIKAEDGFELYEFNPKRIIIDSFRDSIINALYSDKRVIVDDSFFYIEEYTKEEEFIIKNWNETKDFFETKIILDMGAEQIPIDKKVLSRFVSTNSAGYFELTEGQPTIDKNKVRDYVDELLTPYDTYGDYRDFKTTNGDIKRIDLVLYGTLVDHDDLYNYLCEAIESGKKETHTPKYLRKGYARGLNDIGNTFVEVDMGNQILYYYKNGELLLKTDVVTGKPSTMTPAMVTCVYSKSKNVTLRGTNYASFVKYWVPIYPKMGIGLHDASWQSSFGGDLYLTRGSHGCINMITDDIAYLYDELEIGMPVICYY